MKNMKRVVVIAAISLLVVGISISIAQAAGAPAGCTVINVPATISSAGTYCLAKSWIVSIASGNAITVNADNVVIDFSGFEVINTAAGNTATAIRAAQTSNSAVRNGTLSGFNSGINLLGNTSKTGSGNTVENMYVSNVCRGAMQIQGTRVLVRNNVVIGTESASGCYGIAVDSQNYRIINNDVCDITGTSIYGGGVSGIGTGVIDNNRVSSNTGDRGIQVGGGFIGSVIVRNNIAANMNVGFMLDGSGKYQDNLTSGCTTSYDILDPAMIDAGNNN